MKNLKLLCLIFAISSLPILVFADFHETDQVGPGVFHHHIFRQAGPWHIHVLEFPLKDSLISVETIKANDLLYGNERTSSMASRNDHEGHRVVAAINGDFYAAGGIPVGAQVLGGSLLKKPTTRSVFALSPQQTPIIDIVYFNGSVTVTDSVTHPIDGVNEARNTDDLIVFNRFFGSSTGTNYWGTEIIAEYLDEHPLVNRHIPLRIIGKDSIMQTGHGNNLIPENGLVLSGHGSSAEFLNNNIFTGDTILLRLNLIPPEIPIKELIGGTPRLIRNGQISVEWETEGTGQSFAYDRHPRTAIGISADSLTCYFFTVDGRQQGYSAGMSLFELADFMLEWEVYQGVNLDGGGSTTMWVRGSVVNSPSDAGGERAVANSISIVCNAPTGEAAHLKIFPEEAYVLALGNLQFSFSATDRNFNPVNVPDDSVMWECDSSLGFISSQGEFTAGEDTVSGFIYLRYKSLSDSALLHITDVARIELEPSPIILNIGQQELVHATAFDNYEHIIELQPRDYQWSVTDSIGEINAIGLFTALRSGSGFIRAEYHGINGSTRVYIDTLSLNVIEDYTNIEEWSLSGYRINSPECAFTTFDSAFTTPPSSGKLVYSLTTGGVSVLYMNCDLLLSGEPYSVGVDVYGDGSGHWLRGEFADADGEKFLIDFTPESPGINWNNEWRYLQAEITSASPHWGNPSATVDFPIRWTKIYLAETDENNKNSGSILLDNFTVHYLPVNIIDEATNRLPESFFLKSVAPNPFNHTTNFTIEINRSGDLNLAIFDILGREVDEKRFFNLPEGISIIPWNAGNLSSGVYLFHLRMDNNEKFGKCTLLK